MTALIRKQQNTVRRFIGLCAVTLALPAFFHPTNLRAQGYLVSNLVSDLSGAAANTDENLVNAWGLAVLSKDTLIVNANENNIAGLYGTDGEPTGSYLEVGSAPSGLVWNRNGGFKVSDGQMTRSSTLIFVTEEGTILGWNENFADPTAIVAVDNSEFDAVYKGVAILGSRLFAADFKGGVVDVYDSKWNWLGAFTDSHVDEGFGPFNVAAIDGLLYVSFAKKRPPEFEDDEPGAGNGFVDVFTAKGRFVRRLISHGVLNSPWGMVKAPSRFGDFSGALLVGNFGDGGINAFNIKTGEFLGALSDAEGAPIAIDGLWGLDFGVTRVNNKKVNTLFFSAGPNGEGDGLVGKITPN
jgi:uncharacterized protein (TIGR03118 family)